jgi:hypothetical protein
MDILGFTTAFLSDWVGWMSGLFSVILTIVGFRVQAQTHKRLFWASGLLCFFVASIHIWTIEHSKYEAAMGELKNSRPNLSAYVNQVATGTISEDGQDSSMVYLIVSIANSGGSDSVANRFKLTAEVPGKGNVEGVLTLIPKLQRVSVGNQYLDMAPSNLLPQKCEETPIPRGGMRRGWLFYLFPKLTLDEIRSAKLTLKFLDVREVEYSANANLNGPEDEGARAFPGIGVLSK